MNKKSLITVVVASLGTVAALVGLSVLFTLTRVPSLHVELGWVVTALGCALMAWQLRSNVWLTLLVCAAFLPIVRYAAFTIAYGILESGVLWR